MKNKKKAVSGRDLPLDEGADPEGDPVLLLPVPPVAHCTNDIPPTPASSPPSLVSLFVSSAGTGSGYWGYDSAFSMSSSTG